MASAAMDVDAVAPTIAREEPEKAPPALDEPAAKHQKITHVVSRDDDDDEAPPFAAPAPPANAVEPAPLKVRVRLPATASLTRGRSAEAAATMASLLPPPPPPPPQKAPRTVLFGPCDHLVACASCAAALQECPNCRATITTRTTIANSS